ncbi:MAG TPA: pitrilysin family protein [Euzebyales bacterium]|nr:pitrilysin family protein [Euzebyales bacterium]
MDDDVADGSTTPDIRRTTLPSGVRLVTERMPDVRSVSVGFWINTGARDEDARVAGASHFLEHLLFKGTARRSGAEIAGALEAVGGDLNAFTSKEYTCFHARCLDRDLALSVDVLADMVTSAVLSTEDVEAERSVVLEEIRMHRDTPDDLVHSVFSEALFGAHPLGREVLGTAGTIEVVPRDDVYAYYRSRYVAEHLVVAVAGNIEHDNVRDLVAAALTDWGPPGPPPPRRLLAIERPARPVGVRTRPTEQAHICFGGVGFARDDDRRFAAQVLEQAMGGGMASRLFQEVRERRGLAYSVYSYLSSQAEVGYHAVYAGTAVERVDEVLEVVRGELARALADGLDDDELAAAKGALTGSLILGLEETGSRMTRLGRAEVCGLPLLSLDDIMAAIDAVDHEAIAEVTRAMFGHDWSLAIVGPFDDRDLDRFVGFSDRLAA